MSIGPSRITRDRALRAGYVPPLAWDDDQLDNPHAQPHAGDSITGLDEAAIERRAAGDTTVPLTHPERRELVRRLHATGLNHTEIAQRAGINARQVYRDLHRTKEETAA